MKRNLLLVAMVMLGVSPAGALASTAEQSLTGQSTMMDQTAAKNEPAYVTSKFASDFVNLAGSRQNAEALITGLRNGTPITLSAVTTPPAPVVTETTIIPPTKPMGYGNAYITMSLAQAQLASYGVTAPTPEQLQAVLTGGTVTTTALAPDGTLITRTVTVEGILNQRASGMGWGQIAQANGFKLGPVISSMKAANGRLVTAPSPAAQADSPRGAVPSSSGAPASAMTGEMKDRAYRPSAAPRAYAGSSGGITTAMGGSGIVYGKSPGKPGSQLASVHGKAGELSARGVGISTAAGGAASASAAVAHGKQGGSAGSAPGQAKGPK